MCLLEITERVSVHIFEQTKPGIVIVLASELLYLVSSMILEADAIFYPANRFWENRKSLYL